ncbi:MAG: hypothetical protein KDD22_05085, partial [Bdellovibrionales bacterium]|nr:hypothetical protein [Bdellovibrionales bacterium]
MSVNGRLIIAFIATLGMVLFNVIGQGCGDIEGLSVDQSTENYRLNEKVLSFHPDSVYVKDESVFVLAHLARYPEDSQYVWSHRFKDGSVNCKQYVASDNFSAEFRCPEAGHLTIELDVVMPNHQTDRQEISVNISEPVL